MSIKGLTDKPVMRRDGKIRAGYKETKNGKEVPVNCDHFLLHDSAQLIPVLGEKPKEIFFTVVSDDLNAVAFNELRMYTKTELICQGNGETAAYYATGDLPGVKQTPAIFQEKDPITGKVISERTVPRSRERLCQYKQCPDYVKGACSEFIRLGMVIPHYSMGAWFDLENTSINGILNIMAAFEKARTMNFHKGRKISGEIFKLYKEKDSLPYESRDGKKGRSDRDVVHMVHVPFSYYEEHYKGKCPPESWEALMALRGATLVINTAALPAPVEQAQLPAPAPALAGPLGVDPIAGETAIKERANHAGVSKLFDEIALLVGKTNTEELRIATARQFPDVNRLAAYLKKRIADGKKSKEQSAVAAAPVDPTVHTPPPPVVMPAEASLY